MLKVELINCKQTTSNGGCGYGSSGVLPPQTQLLSGEGLPFEVEGVVEASLDVGVGCNVLQVVFVDDVNDGRYYMMGVLERGREGERGRERGGGKGREGERVL